MTEFSPKFEQYVQSVERGENRPAPSMPPVLGTARLDQGAESPLRRRRVRETVCAIPDCSHQVRRSANFPLCTDHLLRVWSFVGGSSEIQSDYRTPWAEVKWRPGDPVPEAITPQEREAQQLAKRQRLREISTTAGHLYVLDTANNTVKIGWTGRELWQRLEEYPPHFRLIVDVPGTRADERDVHRSLKMFRAAKKEWYHVESEVIRQINSWIALRNTMSAQRSAKDRARYGAQNPGVEFAPMLLPKFESLDTWTHDGRVGPYLRETKPAPQSRSGARRVG